MSQSTSKNFIFPNGAYTALATPFCDDDAIDYPSLKRLLDTQYSSGVVGLVLLGSTAEAPTMSEEDKLGILEFVKKYDDEVSKEDPTKHKMLIAGVGGSWTAQVVSFSKKASEFCDALMVTVPAYNKPPQCGIVDLFVQVSKANPEKPIMIYNIPSRTGTDMLPDTMLQVLRLCSNVTALKEASGNWENVNTLAQRVERFGVRDLNSTFKIFSGDDGNALTLCEKFCGKGVVSVASNVIPNKIANLMTLALTGKFEVAHRAMDKHLKDFIKSLFVTSNPIPVKFLLHNTKVFTNDKMRRPLMELSGRKESLGEIIEILNAWKNVSVVESLLVDP